MSTRHAPLGDRPKVSRTRSACRGETRPAFQRHAGIESSPTAANSGRSMTGSRAEVTYFWYLPVGETKRRGRGASWLPMTVRTGPGSLSKKARAPVNCCRRARWVRSPETTTRSGRWSQMSATSDSASSSSWAPKWMSDRWTMTGTGVGRLSDLLGDGVHATGERDQVSTRDISSLAALGGGQVSLRYQEP
jgi:hypothetical protein